VLQCTMGATMDADILQAISKRSFELCAAEGKRIAPVQPIGVKRIASSLVRIESRLIIRAPARG
jgi:hypothetical protein